MSSNLIQIRKMVEQLRIEQSGSRIPMSQSIMDLIQYAEQNKDQDPLIIGIDKKQNPYLEKNSCTIL